MFKLTSSTMFKLASSTMFKPVNRQRQAVRYYVCSAESQPYRASPKSWICAVNTPISVGEITWRVLFTPVVQLADLFLHQKVEAFTAVVHLPTVGQAVLWIQASRRHEHVTVETFSKFGARRLLIEVFLLKAMDGPDAQGNDEKR